MAKTSSESKLQVEKFFYRSLTQDVVIIPNILLRHYKDMGLEESEFIFLLCALAAVPKGQSYFTLHDLTETGHMEANKLPELINCLQKKGLVSKVEDKPLIDAYSLEGLFDKLFELWVYLQACPKKDAKPKTVTKKDPKKELSQIYSLFEGELGRPLSPTEGEKITFWLISDGWDPMMVKEALTRAVIHGTSSLVYIDRILERWRKEGIREISQLKDEQKKTTKTSKKSTKTKPKVMCSETNYADAFNKK